MDKGKCVLVWSHIVPSGPKKELRCTRISYTHVLEMGTEISDIKKRIFHSYPINRSHRNIANAQVCAHTQAYRTLYLPQIPFSKICGYKVKNFRALFTVYIEKLGQMCRVFTFRIIVCVCVCWYMVKVRGFLGVLLLLSVCIECCIWNVGFGYTAYWCFGFIAFFIEHRKIWQIRRNIMCRSYGFASLANAAH